MVFQWFIYETYESVTQAEGNESRKVNFISYGLISVIINVIMNTV